MPNPYEQCVASLKSTLAFYRAHNACPCAFPRFAQLLQFHFKNFTDSPVGCHATEIAIGLVTADDGFYQFFRDAGEVRQLHCKVCGTELDCQWEQFSINMDVTSMRFRIVRAQPEGPSADLQIPMPRGFFGFDDYAIKQAADCFTREATFEEMMAYLTALRES